MHVECGEGSNVGTQTPMFHIRTHVPKPKRHVKMRKKGAARGRHVLTNTHVHGVVNASECINEIVGFDGSSKRKMWDSNVVMEDNNEDLKRLCGENGVLNDALSVPSVMIVSQVAGVGVDQPREQK